MNDFTRRRALKTLFCSSAALALNLQSRRAQAEIAKDGLHFLAIGDFGTGGTDQVTVAKAMQEFVKKNELKSEALLLIGDNFYGPAEKKPKAKGEEKSKKKDKDKKKEKEPEPVPFTVETKRWKTEIEDLYTTETFPGPMYAVLGNHDYHDNKGGEQTQLAYSQLPGKRWKMPAKWYRQDFGGLLTLICLDTNLYEVSGKPSVPVPKKDKDGKIIPPKGPVTPPKPRASLTIAEEVAQMEWLKAELEKPRAPFTLVMGHHPLYSNGDHGDTKTLIDQWEPLFQEHKVHAYICGHDHDLQHLEMDGKFTSHILSGGGGAKTRVLEHPERKMPYGKDIHGFTHITVKPDALIFAHHTVDGSLVHQFTKRLDGKIEVLDVPQPSPAPSTSPAPGADPKDAKI
ncbi:MAG: metallophosphoesterase [Verrucomicrobiota bacterium]